MSTIKSSISDFMGTLQPFIIGGALAYLLNFILRFYEDYILSHEAFNKLKKSGKRGIGLLLTYITASIITYLFIQFVLPQLMDSIIGLVNNIPEYVNDVTKFTNDIVDNLPENVFAGNHGVKVYIRRAISIQKQAFNQCDNYNIIRITLV